MSMSISVPNAPIKAHEFAKPDETVDIRQVDLFGECSQCKLRDYSRDLLYKIDLPYEYAMRCVPYNSLNKIEHRSDGKNYCSECGKCLD